MRNFMSNIDLDCDTETGIDVYDAHSASHTRVGLVIVGQALFNCVQLRQHSASFKPQTDALPQPSPVEWRPR